VLDEIGGNFILGLPVALVGSFVFKVK